LGEEKRRRRDDRQKVIDLSTSSAAGGTRDSLRNHLALGKTNGEADEELGSGRRGGRKGIRESS